MSTIEGATADNATMRNITHADVVRPKQTNSKNASEKKRKRLENRNLSINEDLVEIIEIPARGKKRSVSERSTYEKDRKCGAAELVSEDPRQDQRMSPMKEKEEESQEEERSNSRPLAGSVGRATHGAAEGWSEARECSVLAEKKTKEEKEKHEEKV